MKEQLKDWYKWGRKLTKLGAFCVKIARFIW